MILSSENIGVFRDYGKPLAFIVGGTGGFLFAMYGFYSVIFGEPKSEVASSRAPNGKPIDSADLVQPAGVPKPMPSIILNFVATILWLGAAILFIGSSSWGGDMIPDNVGRFGAISCAVTAIFCGSIAKQIHEAKGGSSE